MTDLFLGAHVPEETTACGTAIGPEPDDVIEEMEAYAETEGFPIVGRTVGGWLSQLARINGASRVFEFGSGFGYSAYWFSRALPADGEIILTELDDDNLELAAEFFEKGAVPAQPVFETGHAVDIAREYDGPFDIALLDIEKYEYSEAFEVIREAIPPGGMVIADNIMTAGRDEVDDTVDYVGVRQVLSGTVDSLDETDIPDSARRGTAGVLAFLDRVREDPAFETTLLPLGDGVTVSTRIRDE